MNLIKPIAIYLGFNWLSKRFDEFQAKVNGIESQKILKARRIMNVLWDDVDLELIVNESFEKGYSVKEIVAVIMSYPRTVQLIQKSISDGKFTEYEISSLIEKAYLKGFESSYSDYERKNQSKFFKSIFNSSILNFFTQPLGFTLLIILLMLQIIGLQYVRNHFDEKSINIKKFFPPFIWGYAIKSIPFKEKDNVSDVVFKADLNSLISDMIEMETITEPKDSSIFHKKMYLLYAKNNKIKANYNKKDYWKLEHALKFMIDANELGAESTYITLIKYVDSEKIEYIEKEEYTKLRTQSLSDSTLSGIIKNVDKEALKFTEGVYNLINPQIKKIDKKVIINSFEKLSIKNRNKADRLRQLYYKLLLN